MLPTKRELGSKAKFWTGHIVKKLTDRMGIAGKALS